MQEYVNLVGSAKVKDSREPINKNFSTVASDFSGESFPTENLIENMTCYRTDLNKTYRYNNGSWVVDGVVSVNGQSPTPSTGNIVLDDYVVSVTADGKTLSIKKKDGTESTINISYNLATQVVDGLMSATDKARLDNIVIPTTLPASGGNADYATEASNSYTFDKLHTWDFVQLTGGKVANPLTMLGSNLMNIRHIEGQPDFPNRELYLQYSNQVTTGTGHVYFGAAVASVNCSNGIYSHNHKSLASSGYDVLENGLILQWGTVGVNDQNTQIYFPVSVSATLAVVPCFEHPSQTSFFRMVAHDNYGFTFKSAYGGTVHWIAICV